MSGPAAEPLGQSVIKIISNLCFSLFVFSVLVFTVIAVTYQAPDPWLESSVALTKVLSSVRNSTFRTDDSLLNTGEDLVPLPSVRNSTFLTDDSLLNTGEDLVPLPSPPQAAPSPESSPELALLAANATGTNCTDDLAARPIDCAADPRVLAAVGAFNQRIFKSIVFLDYQTPAPGGRPNECDVAWRFRNKKEKSWRRYRDFRRFSLALADDCSLAVADAGRWHSGKNARRPIRPTTSTATTTASTSPADETINDTIPTIESESAFRKGRYLYYSRGGDYCKSMNQYLWSFLCGLGEAQFLNRTFVVDLNLCLSASYNPSNKDEEGKDFRFYFDFEHLKDAASVVEETQFLHEWKISERAAKKTAAAATKKKKNQLSVRKVPSYKTTPMQLKKDKSTILWRQFDSPEPENYWYRVCEGTTAKHVSRPWRVIWKSKRLMNIVSEISGRLDWDFDAVHVVRGEKAANKEQWPNLDGDTSPAAILGKLTQLVHPWRKLYIATNELFYNYFDKLRSQYKVHLLDDFQELWGNRSEWYNETMALNGGKPVSFDGYMRVEVDTEVLYRAKTRVETFYNLTKDCKDGIGTC